MAIYLGVGDTSHKVNSVYLGVDNAPRKIKEIYLGSSSNTPQKVSLINAYNESSPLIYGFNISNGVVGSTGYSAVSTSTVTLDDADDTDTYYNAAIIPNIPVLVVGHSRVSFSYTVYTSSYIYPNYTRVGIMVWESTTASRTRYTRHDTLLTAMRNGNGIHTYVSNTSGSKTVTGISVNYVDIVIATVIEAGNGGTFSVTLRNVYTS